jgi:hypothetical protein
MPLSGCGAAGTQWQWWYGAVGTDEVQHGGGDQKVWGGAGEDNYKLN